MIRIPAPRPGVYHNIPFEQYRAWDAMSQSALKHFERSPAHYAASLLAPDQDTVALRLGRAIHSAVFEPDDFARRYTPFDEDRRSAAAKARWQGILDAGGAPIKSAEYATTTQIRDVLRAHPTAGAYLFGEGGANELSIVWLDEESGVTCKARLDRISPLVDGGCILDLKSTEDASEEAFAKAVFNFRYYRQGAFYRRGCAAHEIDAAHYGIVAVEKEPPFGVRVFRLSEADLLTGDAEISALLARYAQCRAADDFPAYPTGVVDLRLPEWAYTASLRLAETVQASLTAGGVSIPAGAVA